MRCIVRFDERRARRSASFRSLPIVIMLAALSRLGLLPALRYTGEAP